jgi:SAM-dependent methyltransferase
MQQERELATFENFDEAGYLLANPDVARHVAAGGDALAHLRRHGLREGRQQVRPSAEERLRRAQARYTRFAPLLDGASGAGGQFRFLADVGIFPVIYGEKAVDLSLYDAECANCGFGPFVEEIRANRDKLYLDIGCGRRETIEPNCLYLEIYRSVSADVVMEPACRYPIASESLDGIGCFAVLEHVKTPWEAAAEFRRMLKPGGKLFIDWPFLQPVHGYPSHYYNATREGLREMFADGFVVAELQTFPNQTPDHMISWILRELVDGITDQGLREQLLGMSLAAIVQDPPGSAFWQRVLKALPPDRVEALASGNTLIATKV